MENCNKYLIAVSVLLLIGLVFQTYRLHKQKELVNTLADTADAAMATANELRYKA